MIRRIMYIGILTLTFGCTNSPKIHSDNGALRMVNQDSFNKINATSYDYNSTYAIWAYDFDESINEFKPIKLRDFNNDTLTIKGIEKIVNNTWPMIQIKYLETRYDTVYIAIPDSELLTQQMGTTGADQFIVSTTYTFTELKGINYVSYKFEPGDHANPGIYSRELFKER